MKFYFQRKAAVVYSVLESWITEAQQQLASIYESSEIMMFGIVECY